MSMIMQWDAVAADEAARLWSASDDEIVDWLEQPDDGRVSFDVDKAWHGIHFTLTGDAWSADGPLAAVVLGGEEFGEDTGYGPPRWLPPEEVAALAAQLDALSPEAFQQRIDLRALTANDIYPGGWDDEPPEAQLQYLVDGYREIRDGFAAAARAGHGFIITIC